MSSESTDRPFSPSEGPHMTRPHPVPGPGDRRGMEQAETGRSRRRRRPGRAQRELLPLRPLRHDDDTNLFMPRTTLGHRGFAASWSTAPDTPTPVQVKLMCGSGDSEGRIKAHDISINAVKVDALSASLQSGTPIRPRPRR